VGSDIWEAAGDGRASTADRWTTDPSFERPRPTAGGPWFAGRKV